MMRNIRGLIKGSGEGKKKYCHMCYHGRADLTDLGSSEHWCCWGIKLDSKECNEKFKLLPSLSLKL